MRAWQSYSEEAISRHVGTGGGVGLRYAARMVARRLAAFGGLVIAGVSGLVIACTTFSAEDVPLGGSDAAPVEAPDAAPVEAAVEAAVAAPFCDTLKATPTFCDDFERATVRGDWTNQELAAGGTVALVPSTRDGGRELQASIPLLEAGVFSSARLVTSFLQTDEITLSYALRLDAPPGQFAQQLMNVNVMIPPSGGDFYAAYLFANSSGVTLVEQTFPSGSGTGGVFAPHPLARSIKYGTWLRIDMLVKTTTPTRLRLFVDGAAAYDGAADPFLRPGTFVVSGGIQNTNQPSGALSVRVDDLYVVAK